MKNTDKSRKWMWWLLAVVAALQIYFVRELLAVFALFAVGFAAVAFVVIGLYMMHKVWEMGVIRFVDSRHPAVNFARRSYEVVDDLARRPFRRPGSVAVR